MIKFTNIRFLLLQIVAHLSLASVLIFGSWIQIITTFIVFVSITLFASTVTYHRLLSHRSWNAPYWYEVFGTILGIFSFTGTPITRTLAHRYHHAHTDTEKDPHSPRILGPYLTYFPMLTEKKLNPILVRDLLNNSFHMFIHNYYFNLILATVALSLLILGPMWTVSLFVAPGALCWNNISICNIFCHYGKDGDAIKHNKLLAFLTFGEGYHKHHHDKPKDPNFGGKEFDIGYAVIKLFERKIDGSV